MHNVKNKHRRFVSVNSSPPPASQTQKRVAFIPIKALKGTRSLSHRLVKRSVEMLFKIALTTSRRVRAISMDLDASKGKLKATEAPRRAVILTEAPCSVFFKIKHVRRSNVRFLQSERENRLERSETRWTLSSWWTRRGGKCSLDSENFTGAVHGSTRAHLKISVLCCRNFWRTSWGRRRSWSKFSWLPRTNSRRPASDPSPPSRSEAKRGSWRRSHRF